VYCAIPSTEYPFFARLHNKNRTSFDKQDKLRNTSVLKPHSQYDCAMLTTAQCYWEYCRYTLSFFCPQQRQGRMRTASSNLFISLKRHVWELKFKSWANRDSIPGIGKRFSSFPERLYRKWGRPSIPFNEYPVFRGRGIKLVTHTHLVPKLRINGAITWLPPYTFIAWTGNYDFHLWSGICSRVYI
jgi:hypothetical protein